MITYKKGNIFESDAEALVNTVNTVGVMGKGIAFQFKKLFPQNFNHYRKICKTNSFRIGDILVYQDSSLLTGEKLILNFPTKEHWRKPSKYEYIEKGILRLGELISEMNIKSIAIPPLGAGNGGLIWSNVRDILEAELIKYPECKIDIYEPNKEVRKVLIKENVELTDARAILLSVLYELVREGEFVSEFACEKVCYFLQLFGAREILKLDYKQHYYGPYSGKVRHLLKLLNGSYLNGFGDNKPFEPLSLLMDTEKKVNDYLINNTQLIQVVDLTKDFLNGFYSSFSLELLSTIHFIVDHKNVQTIGDIKNELSNWSERKVISFDNNKVINMALQHLKEAKLI